MLGTDKDETHFFHWIYSDDIEGIFFRHIHDSLVSCSTTPLDSFVQLTFCYLKIYRMLTWIYSLFYLPYLYIFGSNNAISWLPFIKYSGLQWIAISSLPFTQLFWK